MSSLRVGRYEALRQIASGGMATVYLGRVLGAGGFQRLVALKVMHPHIASDPEFVAMFLDEARLAAGIRHQNVVGTLDIEQGPTGLFLVMEYVEGPSLAQLLKELRKKKEKLPIAVTLRIFLDVLAGLHAAHELVGPDAVSLNLVHRDVSPQNALVGRDGITKITDFGVARAEARISSTRGGQLKGKIPYMAPEQLRAEPIDRRCDVYAAGCLLWEMLAGDRLFQADSDGALVAAVLSGPRRTPRDVNPDVPEAIDEVTMRALETLDDRFRTASAFALAVEQAAERSRIAVAHPRAVTEVVTRFFPTLDSLSSLLVPGIGLPPPGAVVAGPGAAPTELISSSGLIPVSSPSQPSSPSGAAERPMPPPPWASTTGSNPSVVSSTAVVASSVLSSPAPPPRSAQRGATMLALGLGIAVLGGLFAFFLMRGGLQSLPEPASAPPPLPATTQAPPPSAPPTPAPTILPASSASPSAAPAAVSARPSVPKTAKPPVAGAGPKKLPPPSGPGGTPFRPDRP